MSYYTCGTTPENPFDGRFHVNFPYSVFSEGMPCFSFKYKENAEDWCAAMNFGHSMNQGGWKLEQVFKKPEPKEEPVSKLNPANKKPQNYWES